MISDVRKSHLATRIIKRLMGDVIPTAGLLILLALAMTWWNH